MTPEKAEILALEALGWLAAEEDGLPRFLAQSGMDSDALRMGAGSPEMGVAVLEFLLAHEELLLRFCESQKLDPKNIHAGLRALSKTELREI
jgi:hypothetical protein